MHNMREHTWKIRENSTTIHLIFYAASKILIRQRLDFSQT